MDKLKYVKLENEDGSYSSSIPLAVDSDYVDVNGNTLTNELTNKATKTELNTNVSNLQSQISSLASGAPLVASSVSGMTDTTKVYVNTTDGHWYWYNGNSWVDGGVYQATVQFYDKTLLQNNAIPNSKTIGDKINQDYVKYNLLNSNNIQSNKRYGSNGTISDVTDWYIFDDILKAKNGDKLFLQYIDSEGQITDAQIEQIVKVDANGNFLSLVTSITTAYYTFTEDCFFKVNCCTHTRTPIITNYVGYLNNVEYDKITDNGENSINKITSQNNERSIDDITKQYNYFDGDKAFVNQNLDTNGNIVYSSNGFFVTNMIKVKNGETLYSNYFGIYEATHNFFQVIKYDENKRFIERLSVSDVSYTSDFNGYVKFNVLKHNAEDRSHLKQNYAISKGNPLLEFYPNKKYVYFENEYPVKLSKIDSNNFLINFGDFNITLFKTISVPTNANNWNIKDIKKGTNVIVPAGTDIIGPVKINSNTDFIGGVHGDEITNEITVAINGVTYNETELQALTSVLKGNSLTIVMKSICYDQIIGDAAFDRYIIITIENNKIHISNSFKALKNLTLKSATNGGLIACQNPIIKNITMNNLYLNEAPTEDISNSSNLNTNATINTIYGSLTINNIKGYTYPSYAGFLQVFTNETPKRCKIYFDTYKPGNYSISTGDLITGEFEYIFS